MSRRISSCLLGCWRNSRRCYLRNRCGDIGGLSFRSCDRIRTRGGLHRFDLSRCLRIRLCGCSYRLNFGRIFLCSRLVIRLCLSFGRRSDQLIRIDRWRSRRNRCRSGRRGWHGRHHGRPKCRWFLCRFKRICQSTKRRNSGSRFCGRVCRYSGRGHDYLPTVCNFDWFFTTEKVGRSLKIGRVNRAIPQKRKGFCNSRIVNTKCNDWLNRVGQICYFSYLHPQLMNGRKCLIEHRWKRGYLTKYPTHQNEDENQNHKTLFCHDYSTRLYSRTLSIVFALT